MIANGGHVIFSGTCSKVKVKLSQCLIN